MISSCLLVFPHWSVHYFIKIDFLNITVQFFVLYFKKTNYILIINIIYNDNRVFFLNQNKLDILKSLILN